MKTRLPFPLLHAVCAALALAASFAATGAPAVDSARVKKLFANPPREFTSAPLWVWNDLLTEAQIRDTMRDLAGQGVKQVFVHPRPGLMTPYLSDDWFKLWKIALNEAGRLDMNVWIYDENSYPSGFAGGWVPELMPESRGMGLVLKDAKSAPKWDDKTVAVLRLADGKSENVSPQAKAGEALGDGKFLVATIQRAGNSPWYASRCYVNLLTPGVTEKFLDVTLGAYEREIGKEFGKRVPGVFTDEPNIHPAGGFPWCDDLPEQFQKRWGYSLVDNLASLQQPVGDWRKVRHNYYSTLNDLFIERWAKPFHDYCEQRNLEFTGHYWDHDWPSCLGVPDNMAMYAWHQRPAIDCLMNQYAEHTHAQFGNVRMVKELSSVANQLGRQRTLCEIYGAGGWDLRFEDMKRIGDWLEVLGVNTLDEHLSYVTLRGARKNDHPQSFSYHEPWWPAYHTIANYFTRLSAALSQGEQINRVLVIEPTTTAWMYQGDGAKLGELGDAFFKLLMALESSQIEYDLGDEDIIARHGSAEGGKLKIGQRAYDLVVIPPLTENLDRKTWELLHQFILGSGRVLTGSKATGCISDGKIPGTAVTNNERWERTEPAQLPAKIKEKLAWSGTQIDRAPGDKGILFHQRRQLADGEILFLVNTSIEAPSKGAIFTTLKGIECWNLNTGKAEPYTFRSNERGVTAEFDLPPSGSRLLFLSKKPLKPAPAPAETTATLAATGALETRRLEPNVLKLDYVDITAGGETRANVYYYAAAQFAFQKNGMPANPWDSAVQFKDELISKQFPANSGFTASYRFTLEGNVPENLAIVIERPDLYAITCNGQPITAKSGDWWLDKAFGRIAIAKAAKPGENVVTLTAKPFTIYHELEAAFVLGDFALKPASRGFVIAADVPLGVQKSRVRTSMSINPDGTMWLNGGIGFAGGVEDRAPFVSFEISTKPRELTQIRVWNYAEAHVSDLASRGAKEIRVLGSTTGKPDSFDVDLGTFTLARGGAPQDLKTKPERVRFVKFEILSNQNGVRYPATGQPDDNGFVGLAEVEFFMPDRRLGGVKIHQLSSELASHQRQAIHLVDGSGFSSLRPGWNEQGHPFYSAGVAYAQQFEVAKPAGRYTVALPDWYGSVAEVKVNGKSAGYISAPPWECDVTKQIKRGANRVEVNVIGTLKNTLGPHHGNPPAGSAWPGMFRSGPADGPPPGERYSTIGYGLFEPFVLKQTLATKP